MSRMSMFYLKCPSGDMEPSTYKLCDCADTFVTYMGVSHGNQFHHIMAPDQLSGHILWERYISSSVKWGGDPQCVPFTTKTYLKKKPVHGSNQWIWIFHSLARTNRLNKQTNYASGEMLKLFCTYFGPLAINTCSGKAHVFWAWAYKACLWKLYVREIHIPSRVKGNMNV